MFGLCVASQSIVDLPPTPNKITLPQLPPNTTICRVSVEDAAAGICGYLVEAEVSGADVKGVYEMAKKGAALNAAYPGYRRVLLRCFVLCGVRGGLVGGVGWRGVEGSTRD